MKVVGDNVQCDGSGTGTIVVQGRRGSEAVVAHWHRGRSGARTQVCNGGSGAQAQRQQWRTGAEEAVTTCGREAGACD